MSLKVGILMLLIQDSFEQQRQKALDVIHPCEAGAAIKANLWPVSVAASNATK